MLQNGLAAISMFKVVAYSHAAGTLFRVAGAAGERIGIVDHRPSYYNQLIRARSWLHVRFTRLPGLLLIA